MLHAVRVRGVAAALLLPAVIAMADPAQLPAQAPAAGLGNVQVSHGRYRAYGEPYLAVNPRDPRNLLGAAQCITGLPIPCTFASFDGGRTWRENGALPLPAGDRAGGDVSVAFDNRGRGFVASHAGRGWNVDTVLVWRTDDGGRIFDWPAVVFPASGGRVVVDHPWLAVDATRGVYAGTVYVAWTANYGHGFGPATRLLFSRSIDGGRSFSAPRTIARVAHGFPAIPVIAVGPTGRVYVAYAVGYHDPYTPPFSALTRMLISSSDGGRSFGPARPIAAEPAFLTLPGLRMANIQAVATDPRDGTLYATMAAVRPGTRHTEILLWRSRDGGRSWAAPVRVNDDPGDARAGQADHFQPQLAVSAQGTVYVSYFALVRGRVDSLLAWSTAHGARFGPGERITTVSFDPRRSGQQREGPWIGDYQGLALGPRAIYPFWNDTRTGHMEIFTAAVGIVCC